MSELKVFADIVDRQPEKSVQDTLMGGYFGLLGSIQRGSFNGNKNLDEVMREHLSAFSYGKEGSNEFSGDDGAFNVPLRKSPHELSKQSNDSYKGDFIRRGCGTNAHRPMLNRLKSGLEKGKKKRSGIQTCGFCGEDGHQQGNKCDAFKIHKLYLADEDKVLKLKLSLGNTEIHKVTPCPPMVTSIVQKREISGESILGWLNSAKHIILHRAFYDCYVPHHGTRYSQGPPSGASINSIIEVSFLTNPGCIVYNDSSGTSLFYYRAKDVMQLISQNVNKKKGLISLLKLNQFQ